MPVAAVGGVGELAQAVRAGRDVGRGKRAGSRLARGVADPEPGAAARGDFDDVDGLDHSQRRRVVTQPAPKAAIAGGQALDLDDDAA